MAIDLKSLDSSIEELETRRRKLEKLRTLLKDEETMELISDPEIQTMIRGSASTNGNHVAMPTREDELEEMPIEGSLKRAVLDVALKCPTKFDGKYILEQLKLAHYKLEAQKPEVSIHGALISLSNPKNPKKKFLRLVRKGSGRQPNIYEAIRKASE
ncbi:MAG TPA: hypothetical protein VNW97_22470 [Candidatus Saccharimonadales bacterium]|jgi:hypothetical protein|nr:hypothetical protein [Candidatus Saccharimonadales bacterium]